MVGKVDMGVCHIVTWHPGWVWSHVLYSAFEYLCIQIGQRQWQPRGCICLNEAVTYLEEVTYIT